MRNARQQHVRTRSSSKSGSELELECARRHPAAETHARVCMHACAYTRTHTLWAHLEPCTCLHTSACWAGRCLGHVHTRTQTRTRTRAVGTQWSMHPLPRMAWPPGQAGAWGLLAGNGAHGCCLAAHAVCPAPCALRPLIAWLARGEFPRSLLFVVNAHESVCDIALACFANFQRCSQRFPLLASAGGGVVMCKHSHSSTHSSASHSAAPQPAHSQPPPCWPPPHMQPSRTGPACRQAGRPCWTPTSTPRRRRCGGVGQLHATYKGVRQAGRQAGRRADRQAGGQTGRQAGRQAVR